jgi:hypothetical protein
VRPEHELDESAMVEFLLEKTDFWFKKSAVKFFLRKLIWPFFQNLLKMIIYFFIGQFTPDFLGIVYFWLRVLVKGRARSVGLLGFPRNARPPDSLHNQKLLSEIVGG